MNLKKIAAQAAIAAVLGLPALGLGVGVGTASADPGPPCGNYCQGQFDQRGPDGDRGDGGFRGDGQFDQRGWNQRGIDDGRLDHQPFDYQGQRVEPYFDNGQGAWGFQFFGIFVPM
jgi:hypothetical protein